MNSIFEAHKDRLSHCIILYGTAGLLFYAAMLVGSSVMKHGMQVLQLVKGFGL
jgi:hypothetical protein